MRTLFVVAYVELHCHSAFSFLDGASLPDELVPAALELGYGAVALTDHNSVSGSMEFAVTARALGLRAIHGAEVDLDDGRHLTLLVEDARGWSNLCRILVRAHAHTREGDGVRRRRPASRSATCSSTPRGWSASAGARCAACTTSRPCAACWRRSAPIGCGSSSSVPS